MNEEIKPLTMEQVAWWKSDSIEELKIGINVVENRNLLRLIATIEEAYEKIQALQNMNIKPSVDKYISDMSQHKEEAPTD